MADEAKNDELVQPIVLEDGRKAERKTVKRFDPKTREGTEVIETSVEPKVELRLARREIVKTRPVVHRREVEFVDEETGEVLKREVESIDPDVKMEVRERVLSAAALPEEPDSGLVTRAELREDIRDAICVLDRKMNGSYHVSAQSMVEQRLTTKTNTPWLNVALIGTIGALIAGIVWVIVAV